MSRQFCTLDDLIEFFDRFFAIHLFPNDPGGVYRPSTRSIQRFGLALEPWSELTQWARVEGIDALFLHRPWKLEPEQLAADVGIMAYHLAFDERMTLGFNPRLAEVLGMSDIEVLGEKEGRPIGMIADIPSDSFASYCGYVEEVFGGLDAAPAGVCDEVRRVAVVGAMNDALVREAAARGADVYITGQLRQPAALAVKETGIGAIAIGHRRSEEWGLRALAGVVRDRWSKLEVVLPKKNSA
jgi:putative NIF3 family GTP cyclohydrolase 1 type 2